MADPRLEGRYPMRGLYQALAVASMCIQSEAASRPLIADVVTALSYLASQTYDPATAHAGPGRSERRGQLGNNNNNNNNSSSSSSSNNNTSSGNNGNNSNTKERDDSPRDLVAGILNKDFDRERAVAEAKMWGENWREKRKAMIRNAESSPSVSS